MKNLGGLPQFTLKLDGDRRVRFVIDLADQRVRLYTADEAAEPIGVVVGVAQRRPSCRLFGQFTAELNSQRADLREAAQLRFDDEQARMGAGA